MGLRRGFTLIEVLVATIILGLGGGAALALTSASLRSLDKVRQEENLQAKAEEIRVLRLAGKLSSSGSENGVSWTEIPGSDNGVQYQPGQLVVKAEGRSVTLYVP
jgi:prepilin-type N-terminal cleavage/methylation domain-containing protein